MAIVDSIKNNFLLSEIDDYSAINVPLKTAGRIKYTCFDVSQSFLAFGATSGGLYVFKREPCTFIQLLPNKEGPITLVSISPDEKLFAFVSQRGVVCVLERTEGVSTRLLNRSTEHSGSTITAIQWMNTSDQIFIGDKIGRLSVINVSLFMSKNIFQIPAFIFMQLDSSVVQISCRDDRLLISTLTHCYVCDTAKEQYRQIGTKPRDGEYGACYLNDKIFCARPGSRLWEVDLEGIVQSTHQFKQLLATKPVLVVTENGLFDNFNNASDYSWPEQNINFVKLSPVLKFLFTFKSDGIYIFDPEKVNVVLWSNHFKNIIDAKCLDDRIYVWTETKKLHALTIVTLDKCLLRLYFREKYNICSELLMYFSDHLLQSKEFLFKLNPLLELKNYVDCNNDILRLLTEIETASLKKEKATRLESGIFMVDNHHVCQKYLLENKHDNNLIHLSTDDKDNHLIQNGAMQSRDHQCIPSSESPVSLPELIRSSGRLNLIGLTDCNNTPQIPSIPISSPDIIHDALLEISCSVSDKLLSGKKTLKDKWQVLEGKLKFSTKIDTTYAPFDVRSSDDNNKENIVNGDIVNQLKLENHEELSENGNRSDEDDPIVMNKTQFSTKKLRGKQKFIANDLINICFRLDKLDCDKRLILLHDLLITIVDCYKKYNDFIMTSNYSKVTSSTNQSIISTDIGVKYFPFNMLLPENYVLLIKNIFHDSLKSNDLIKWLKSNQTNPIFNGVININSMRKYHPKILSNIYPNDVLLIDSFLSELLIIFSELLDPYTILQSLFSIDLPCTYLSWCSVMDRFQEGAVQYFKTNNITNNNENSAGSENLNIGCKDWPLPLLLNAMFLLLSLDQVEPAVKMGEASKIALSTVSYILLKLSAHLQQSGINELDADKKTSNLFLMYISKIVADINIDFDNVSLISHIEESFIIVNKDLNYDVCHCGFPKTNIANHTLSKSYQNIKYPIIAEKLLNYFWDSRVTPDLLSHMSTATNNVQNDENFWSLLGSMDLDHIHGNESLQHLRRICSVAPPLLLWLLKNKIKQDLFMVRTILVLQLGQLHEFDNGNINGLDKWEQVVALNCRIECGECCFCNRKYVPVPGINWSHLAILILRTIGPSATLMILKKYINELPHGVINKRFYQACMLSSYVEARVSCDDGDKREKVVRTVNCIAGVPNYDSPAAFVSSKSEAGTSLALAMSSDIPEPDRVLLKLLNSDNYHWGTTVDLKNGCCNLCFINLGAPRLLLDTGLRVFKCSHAYHFVCLRVKQSVKSCPICSR